MKDATINAWFQVSGAPVCSSLAKYCATDPGPWSPACPLPHCLPAVPTAHMTVPNGADDPKLSVAFWPHEEGVPLPELVCLVADMNV